MLHEIISYTLLAILALLSAYSASSGMRDQFGRRHMISANSLLSLLFAIYIVFAASLSIVFDDFMFTWAPLWSGAEYSVTTLSVCILSIVIYSCTYRWFTSTAESKSPLRTQDAPTDDNMRLALYLLLVVGIFLKIYTIVSMGGVQTSVARMSNGLSEVFALDRLDSSVTIVKSFSTMGDFAATALLVMGIRRRRIGITDILIFGAVCSLSYLTSGKRTFLLEPICAILIAFSIYRKHLGIKWLPLVGMVSIFGGMTTIWLRSIYAAEINNLYISAEDAPWAHGSVFGFYFYSLEFSFFEAITSCIQQGYEINNLFGGSWTAFYTTNLEPILYIIPRTIWPGKPNIFYDYSHGITSIMFGLPLSDSYWGTASSFIGTSWAIGGFLGLIGYSFFLGLISSKFDGFLFRAPQSPNLDGRIHLYTIFLFSAFVLWRQGGLGFSFMSIFSDQLGYIFSAIAFYIWGRTPIFYVDRINAEAKLERKVFTQ